MHDTHYGTAKICEDRWQSGEICENFCKNLNVVGSRNDQKFGNTASLSTMALGRIPRIKSWKPVTGKRALGRYDFPNEKPGHYFYYPCKILKVSSGECLVRWDINCVEIQDRKDETKCTQVFKLGEHGVCGDLFPERILKDNRILIPQRFKGKSTLKFLLNRNLLCKACDGYDRSACIVDKSEYCRCAADFQYGDFIGLALGGRLAELWGNTRNDKCVSVVGAIAFRALSVNSDPRRWALEKQAPIFVGQALVDGAILGGVSSHAEMELLENLMQYEKLHPARNERDLGFERVLLLVSSWPAMCGECACAAMAVCKKLDLGLEVFTLAESARQSLKKSRDDPKKHPFPSISAKDFLYVKHTFVQAKKSVTLDGLENRPVSHDRKWIHSKISKSGHVKKCRLSAQSHLRGFPAFWSAPTWKKARLLKESRLDAVLETADPHATHSDTDCESELLGPDA